MAISNSTSIGGLDNTALLSSIASLSNFPFTFQLPLNDQHKYTGHDTTRFTGSLSIPTSSSSNAISSELMNLETSFNVISSTATSPLFNLTRHTTINGNNNNNGINMNNHFTRNCNNNNTNNALLTPATSFTTITTTSTATITDSNRVIDGVGRGGGSGDGGGGDDVGGKLPILGGTSDIINHAYTMAGATLHPVVGTSYSNRTSMFTLSSTETADSITEPSNDVIPPTNTTTATAIEPTSDTNSGNDSKSSDLSCKNCETTVTPLWRRDPEGNPLCNACGLFLKLHGVLRPKSLKTSIIKKRNRRPRPVAIAHTSHIRPAPPNYHNHQYNNGQHYPVNYTSSHLPHDGTASINVSASSQIKRIRTNEQTAGYHLTTQPLDNSSESRQTVALAIAERLHNQRVLAAARLAAERMSRAEERHGNYYVGHALAPTEQSIETDVVNGFWFHNIPQYNNDIYAEYDDMSSNKDDVLDVEMC
jgi:hypothetical protein